MVRKKRKLLLTLAAVLIAAALTACSSGQTVKFGTAGIGGNYYLLGTAYAGYASDDIKTLKIEARETAGSAANLRLMSEDYIQLAIVQADTITDAVLAGNDSFSAIGSLYTEYCQIVTPADSGIQSVTDLMGRSISIGEEESGTEKNAVQILQAYGINTAVLDAKNMTYSEAAAAMKSGDIEAMFVTAGAQTAVIEELAKEMDIRFLNVDGSAADILMDSYEFYTAETIPAGTYTGQDADVETVGVKSVMIVSNELSADTVKSLTAVLFTHAAELRNDIPLIFELTPESSVQYVSIPFHEGAKQYYEENGIQIPSGK